MPILVLAGGICVLALSEVGQTWEMMRLASSYEVPGRVGDLVSATLANGQVFFGTLDSASRTTIQLHDVFFAQLPTGEGRNQDQDADHRALTILRRKDNEWTQAEVMAIPIERIAFMETVGVDSRIARFIADARSHLPTIQTDQPGGRIPAPTTAQPVPSASPSATPPKN